MGKCNVINHKRTNCNESIATSEKKILNKKNNIKKQSYTI